MSSTTEHLTRVMADTFLIGRLDAREHAAAASHTATCERCRRLVARARGDNAYFLTRVAPRTLPGIQRRLGVSRRPRWWALAVAPALAAAIVLLLFLPRTRRPPHAEWRIKGDTSLSAWALRGKRVFPVTDGMPLAQGDRVRFVIEPGDARYALIASVDGAGTSTIYYPYLGRESALLEGRPPRVEVPDSIILDGTQGPERVFALFTRVPLSSESVIRALQALHVRGRAAVRRAQVLDVPTDGQATLLFEKTTP